jgi:hypothetical protein
MTAQLNSLRTEIRGLKVVLKSLTDDGADLQDPRVQEVRSKMIKLRDRLGELTKSTVPTVNRLNADVSRPAAALGASTFTNNS